MFSNFVKGPFSTHFLVDTTHCMTIYKICNFHHNHYERGVNNLKLDSSELLKKTFIPQSSSSTKKLSINLSILALGLTWGYILGFVEIGPKAGLRSRGLYFVMLPHCNMNFKKFPKYNFPIISSA